MEAKTGTRREYRGKGKVMDMKLEEKLLLASMLISVLFVVLIREKI